MNTFVRFVVATLSRTLSGKFSLLSGLILALIRGSWTLVQTTLTRILTGQSGTTSADVPSSSTRTTVVKKPGRLVSPAKSRGEVSPRPKKSTRG